MKAIIWLAVISCVLLAAFLWFRPVVGEWGRPASPDTSGRAVQPVPDGVTPGGGTRPGTEGAGAADGPTAGAPPASGISHPEALEQKVLELTNAERRKQGLEPLQPESTLVAIARGHSDDMLVRGFFDHVNPDGLSDGDRVAVQHRRLIGLSGENIWKSTGLNPSEIEKVAHEMMYGEQGLMHSPGHRANILRREYTHLGVGIAVRGGGLRATQLFAVARAYTDQPVPAAVSAGASLNLSAAPFNSGPVPGRYDYWVSNRGVNTGDSYPVGDGTVRVGAGVYKLRFYFPGSDVGTAASYKIYTGPQVEVR